MGQKGKGAGICLCLILVGSAGEIVRFASPLCDWHSTACGEKAELPLHTDVSSLVSSSS